MVDLMHKFKSVWDNHVSWSLLNNVTLMLRQIPVGQFRPDELWSCPPYFFCMYNSGLYFPYIFLIVNNSYFGKIFDYYLNNLSWMQFLQLFWAKSAHKYLYLGELFCTVCYRLRFTSISISHWECAGLATHSLLQIFSVNIEDTIWIGKTQFTFQFLLYMSCPDCWFLHQNSAFTVGNMLSCIPWTFAISVSV